MNYLKFNTNEMRSKFDNQREYEIYMIRYINSNGHVDSLVMEDLECLNDNTIRKLFCLSMDYNRAKREINDLGNKVGDLERELEVYKEYD